MGALVWNPAPDLQGMVDAELRRAFLGVTLPSEESANELVVEKKPGSFWKVLLHYLGRSVIIGFGLAAAGARGTDLVKYSLAAAGVIEASVLTYAWVNQGAPLPSGQIADDLAARKPGSVVRWVFSVLMRAIEIGIGVGLMGARGKDLVKYSLAGSAAVELFVQAFAFLNRAPEKS